MAGFIKSYKQNTALITLKAPAGWQGNPIDKDGRFLNLSHPYSPKLLDVIRWKFQVNPFRELKNNEVWQPKIFRDDTWLAGTENMIVWLGHSTFYIRVNGTRFLIDPVFGDIFSVKRKSPFPIAVELLKNIDYILISHDHRDHLDRQSLEILARQNPDAVYLSGLEMGKIIRKFTGSANIQEAGWYQNFLTLSDSMNVTFVPSRHWSKRGLSDTNKRLWGGFVIEFPKMRIIFGGDSGYDAHYVQLASVFGGFNYAILGIGAHEPSWFMAPNHQSPEEALHAFAELRADRFIPMHYGTFDLSDEPLNQPLEALNKKAATEGILEKVNILSIGEPLVLPCR